MISTDFVKNGSILMKLLRILVPAVLLVASIAGCTTTVVAPHPGYYGPGYGHCWVNQYTGVTHCN